MALPFLLVGLTGALMVANVGLHAQANDESLNLLRTPSEPWHRISPVAVPAIDSMNSGEARPGGPERGDSIRTVFQEAGTGHWSFIVGSLAITVVLIETDQSTYDAVSTWREGNAAVRSISPIVTQLGSGVLPLGLFGGLWAYSAFAHDESALRAGRVGLGSFLFTGFVVQLLKQVFGRERPSAATRPGGTFHGPFSYFSEKRGDHKGWTHFDAFPSGHTATAFAAATVLSDTYGTTVVTCVSYTLATLVGISRITEETHWASDVFAGAVIGYLSAKLVERMYDGSPHLRVEPVVSDRLHGIKLGMNF